MADTGAETRSVLAGLGRALGGALIFVLPLVMTMEMWQFGFVLERWRLVLLVVLNVPLLVILADKLGFEPTRGWREAVRDAAIAYGIGALVSALLLFALAILPGELSPGHVVGTVLLLAVPASIGALLSRSQLGGGGKSSEDEPPGYGSELFFMATGAIFLALNVAPTEEMILISYKMTAWHAIALILVSIACMHGFVYSVSFKGGTDLAPDVPWWSAFLRFTLVGYVIALAISFYLLWTFGRTDGQGLGQTFAATVVLGFPAAIGAAAARLIV